MNAKKKKRLGRGLDALLGGAETKSTSSTVSASADSNSTNSDLHSLPIEKLQPGQYQPRTNMDAESLDELASSIKAQGIIQPILVRPIGGERYEIIAGERRWRAAQLAQLDDVPVLVRDIPDEATLAVALIENIQRENLNPIEEAMGLKRLSEEFHLTHEQMAKSVGRSRTAVTNLLRLLSLSSGAKSHLEHRRLEMGHARAILGLPLEQQDSVADEVVAKQMSVRQTEALIKKLTKPAEKPKAKKKNADIQRLESTLSEQLGTTVTVNDSNGKGKLIIEYRSLDILDGIISKIH